MASDVARARTNRLLAALTDDELGALLPDLQREELELRDMLHRPDEPVQDVYFPVSCVISLVHATSSDDPVEVATVGNEGMAGLPVFLGGRSSPGTTFAQVAGEALRMDADRLKAAITGGDGLRDALNRYTLALLTQIAQASACNRMHQVHQRCARWLAMSHDRVGRDEFTLTHQFLAQMLGVRRASVSEVAADLAERGLIRYHRGHLTIVDRAGLDAACCECYKIIADEYDRLLPRAAEPS